MSCCLGKDTDGMEPKKLASGESDASSNQPIMPVNKPKNNKIQYSITVKTGDFRNSGTKGPVYINIFGRDEKQTENLLLSASNRPFTQSSTRKFEINAIDIGKPQKIIIKHEDKSTGWYVDYVEISVHNFLIRFVANRWLNQSKNDRRLDMELFGSEQPAVMYNVEIQTGDEQIEPLDSPVYIQIYGTTTTTPKLFLESKNAPFDKGSNSKFSVSSNNVGEIQRIVIGHEGLGTMNDWYLKSIKLEMLTQQQEYVVEKWLSPTQGDQRLFVELPEEKPPVSTVPPMYLISVQTADVTQPTTTENVEMIVRGSTGQIARISLKDYAKSNANQLFQRGNLDQFELEHPNIGTVENITIGFSGSEKAANWLLEYVDIRYGESIYHFPAHYWLSSRLGPNFSWAILRPDVNNDDIHYKIHVETGQSGIEANVILCIFGDQETTTNLPLKTIKDGAHAKFEKDSTLEFDLQAVDVGKIKKINIGHDGKGAEHQWFLKAVQIEKKTEKYHFKADRWLSDEKDDHKTFVDLLPDEPKTPSTTPVLKKEQSMYKITVVTSSEENAGTDSGVLMTIVGDKDITKQFPLINTEYEHHALFETGKTNEFDMEMDDVGKINKINIGQDGKGSHPHWHLESVQIQKGSEKYHFLANKTLDQSTAFIDLTPTSVHPKAETPTPGHPKTEIPASGEAKAETPTLEHAITETLSPGHPKVETSTPGHSSTEVPTHEHVKVKTSTPEHVKTETSTHEHVKVKTPTPEHAKAATPTHEHAKAETPTHGHTRAETPTSEHAKVEKPTPAPAKAKTPAPVPDKAEKPTPVHAKGKTSTLVPTKTKTPAPAPVKVETPRAVTSVPKSSQKKEATYRISIQSDQHQKDHSNIYLSIHGANNHTEKLFLKDSKASDKKTECEFKTIDVGKISKIVLGQEKTENDDDSWHIDNITIKRNTDTTTFNVDRKLDITTPLVLTPSPLLKKSETPRKAPKTAEPILKTVVTTPEADYTINISTGDQALDAPVILRIRGEIGTVSIPLTKTKTDAKPFQSKASDEFTCRTTDVGKIKRIALEHQGTDERILWHVKSLQIKKDNEPYTFVADVRLDYKDNKINLYPVGSFLGHQREDYVQSELRRLRENLRTESAKLRPPQHKAHEPFVYNDLSPYFDTRAVERAIYSPGEAPPGYHTRATALQVVEPWEAHGMDHNVSQELSKPRKTRSLSAKRPLPNSGDETIDRKQGSTHLPKFPAVNMRKPAEYSRSLNMNDVPKIRSLIRSRYTAQAGQQIEKDYKRTHDDFYRMQLDNIAGYHQSNRENMIQVYHSYLENTPGSKKAVQELCDRVALNSTKSSVETTV